MTVNKFAEESKKEERLLVPKIENDLSNMDTLLPSLTNASVKLELQDDFADIESDSRVTAKSSTCTSGVYDEWLEIQKELGVYTSSATDSSKYRLLEGATTSKSTRLERTRANGECRANEQSALKHSSEVEKHECSNAAIDLERDLLEDTDSLDDLTLYSQSQGQNSLSGPSEAGNTSEHDDITAQVQSAIDSILNLKKRPSTAACSTSGSTSAQSAAAEPKEAVDQAVRSILGS